VLIANAVDIPNVLREISRLREITFREIGEGTNHSYDSDEFDLYYKHLFIWDTTEQKMVGAYRIGEGDKIFTRFKKKGFYLNELFKFKKEFNPIFRSSLEMGRSFVVKEYQRKPHSLMLLWKGVNEFLKRNEGKYAYLIGPVSISNKFSDLSKDILVDYIYNNHFDNTAREFVKPRKQYKYKHRGEGKKLKQHPVKDIKFLDQLISDIEPDQSKIPVLLKKYLMQNAKIIAFNVDPKFNNSVDGLLVMTLRDVPEETFGMVN
jgi:putative hemolysin